MALLPNCQKSSVNATNLQIFTQFKCFTQQSCQERFFIYFENSSVKSFFCMPFSTLLQQVQNSNVVHHSFSFCSKWFFVCLLQISPRSNCWLYGSESRIVPTQQATLSLIKAIKKPGAFVHLDAADSCCLTGTRAVSSVWGKSQLSWRGLVKTNSVIWSWCWAQSNNMSNHCFV